MVATDVAPQRCPRPCRPCAGRLEEQTHPPRSRLISAHADLRRQLPPRRAGFQPPPRGSRRRLHPANSPPSFHLVGCLSIEEALIDMTADPGPGWWDCNAHVRRARATGRWDSFWVFKGAAEKTRAFAKAHRFERDEAESVFGRGWRWRPSRTDLQTIGSYTRAVRRVDGPGEEWLRTICQS